MVINELIIMFFFTGKQYHQNLELEGRVVSCKTRIFSVSQVLRISFVYFMTMYSILWLIFKT